MTNRTATLALLTDLAATAGGAPEWVELLPAGPRIDARDGRSWTYDPAVVIAAFRENRGPLPIDFEHAQDHLAPKGHPAPAAGWISALEERAGAVWGKVEWTTTAAQMIVERAYRFLSPAMRHTRDGVVTRLVGAGLVNRPALEMTALSRETETDIMNFKAIAKALGLAETADETAILSALEASRNATVALCQVLEIDVKSTPDAIQTAVSALRTEHATALAAADRSGIEELATLRSELDSTRIALAAIEEERQAERIEAVLDAAQAEGRITPASREEYRALCQAEGGLSRFQSLVKTLPIIGTPSRLGAAPEADRGEEPDPVALAARARKYQDEQAAEGRTISISEAVVHVKDQK